MRARTRIENILLGIFVVRALFDCDARADLVREDTTLFDHELFSGESLQILGLGGALAMTSIVLGDRRIQSYFSGRDRWGNIGQFGDDIWGTGIPGSLIAAGTWSFGKLSGREYEVQAGAAHAKALMATGAITTVMKFGVGRVRPDGSSSVSFPSGHTSTSFATAASLMGSYGWSVGLPAYFLATYTGLARMEANRHYLSDVVFGATLGIWSGRAFTFNLKRARVPASSPPPEDKESQASSVSPVLSLQPYYEARGDFGFRASLSF